MSGDWLCKLRLLPPSVPLHICATTQGVRTQGTIETTQAVRLPQLRRKRGRKHTAVLPVPLLRTWQDGHGQLSVAADVLGKKLQQLSRHL